MCFTPPYLYILINFIILTIIASSKFHNHHHHHSPPEDTVLLPSAPSIYNRPPAAVQIHVPDTFNVTTAAQTDNDADAVASDKYLNETKLTPSYDTFIEGNGSIGFVYDENTPVKATVNNDDFVGAVSPSLQRKDSWEFAFADENEKSPVSARFSHRKAIRASLEGGKVVALGVAKAKKQETLDSTWRKITEGRAMPLTRHLKKAETWET